ncbi:MAG: hypothetical protein ABIQ30_13570 [Devosia sp.]
MNRLILALALTPALFVTGAMAQTVSEDVSKQLWCGTAMTVAFSNPPPDVTSEQMAEAQTYIDGGTALTDAAVKAHLDAGFTQEQIDKLKADLVTEVTTAISGDGANAKYTFEECAALLPGASSAPADASSSSAQ